MLPRMRASGKTSYRAPVSEGFLFRALGRDGGRDSDAGCVLVAGDRLVQHNHDAPECAEQRDKMAYQDEH